MGVTRETIIRVVLDLPSDKLQAAYEFLSELDESGAGEGEEGGALADGLTQQQLDEEEAKWQATFARPESQELLKEMAERALAEHRAGKTLPLGDVLSRIES
jgi:nitrate reductase assembly molybdenum cofactor insertion protein NarJ